MWLTMMRHGKKIARLGRPADQRKALIRSLVGTVSASLSSASLRSAVESACNNTQECVVGAGDAAHQIWGGVHHQGQGKSHSPVC